METSNLTFFIIKGISDNPDLQPLIFLMVLIIYLFSLCGNLTIIILVFLDSPLHTPMYFFLCNLSIMDLSSITTSLHKVLFIFITGNNIIYFPACITQFYIFGSISVCQLFILAAMGYDRYVAICNPLRYQMVMNQIVCVLLATLCWVIGFLEVLPTTWLLSKLSCYRSNEINHFFCDIVPLLAITCSDTSVLELYLCTGGFLIAGLIPFNLTMISYIFIVMTILKIRSSTGRRKAIFTCSSHLTVVILLYLTLFCQYLTPVSTEKLGAKKFSSLINTAAVPVLNPLIYSLKNKDVKSALERNLKTCKSVISML
ncbi:olfactory receptor 1019-like [Bombina bombina]|uniref:olfactory receptor 1019-like n=1 Tax=Bombina bombina TaxID=8345 RepID=UPI00235ADFF1|nr:olfactory receptor 1019-like [Bombina bombina]